METQFKQCDKIERPNKLMSLEQNWRTANLDQRAYIESPPPWRSVCRLRAVPECLAVISMMLVAYTVVDLFQQAAPAPAYNEEDTHSASQAVGIHVSYNHGSLSADGNSMLVTASGRQVIELDVETGDVLNHFETPRDVHLPSYRSASVTYLPDGNSFLSGYVGGVVYLWKADASGTRQPLLLGRHPGMVYACAVTRDGHRAVTCCRNGTAILWNLDTCDMIRQWQVCDGSIDGVQFSPIDDTIIAVGDANGCVHMIDLDNEGQATIWLAHENAIKSLSFSTDGSKLATCGFDGHVAVWNTRTAEKLVRIQVATSQLVAVCLTNAGQIVATTDNLGGVLFFDAHSGVQIDYVDAHERPVSDLILSHDKSSLISIGNDGTIQSWELPNMGRAIDAGEAYSDPTLTRWSESTVRYEESAL